MKFLSRKKQYILLKILFLLLTLSYSSIGYSKRIVVTSSLDSVPGSLRSSIDLAISGDTIVFKLADKSNSIYLKDSLSIQKSLIIDGLSNNTLDTITVHQTAEYRGILSIRSKGIDITLKNIKLANGQAGAMYVGRGITINLLNCHFDSNFHRSEEFPGIYVDEKCNVIIKSSIISMCKIGYSGSPYAFYSYNSNVTIEDSFFYGNDGRAIYINGGSLNIKRTDIFKNHTGLKMNNATLQMADCSIYDNVHIGHESGGGLLLYDTKSIIDRISIINNKAGQGAAIYSFGGDFILTNSQITDNSSGIFLYSRQALIEDCDISDNWSNALYINNKKSFGEGADDDVDGRNIIVNRCTINNNKVNVSGGGPSNPYAAAGILAYGPFYLSNSTVSSNTADYAAGVWMSLGNGKAYLINNTFYDNTSRGATNYYSEESAIYISLDYSSIDGNKYYPKVDLINNTITNNNSLGNKGTGIHIFLSTYTFSSLGYGAINLYNNIIAYNGSQDITMKMAGYEGDYQFYKTNISGKSNLLNIDKENFRDFKAEFVNYKDSPYLFKNNPAKLDNNGGPTKTIALSNQSLAKESGTSSEKNIEIPITDQRGVLRGLKPSIGAIEYEKYDEGVSGIGFEVTKPIYDIISSHHELYISGLLDGDFLKIYTIRGNIIYNRRLYTADIRVALDPGFYVVKINEYAQKVLIP